MASAFYLLVQCSIVNIFSVNRVTGLCLSVLIINAINVINIKRLLSAWLEMYFVKILG